MTPLQFGFPAGRTLTIWKKFTGDFFALTIKDSQCHKWWDYTRLSASSLTLISSIPAQFGEAAVPHSIILSSDLY